MARVQFTKMEGAGNDFLAVDGRSQPLAAADYGRFAARYCRRRRGVGADGLLVLLEAREPGYDFAMRFFNPDGSEAEMCGNGARCIALFAHRLGAAGRRMRFQTVAGPVEASITAGGVRLLMPPVPAPEEREVEAAGRRHLLYFTTCGVPHAVLPVEELETVDVAGLGAAIRYHPAFQPAGTNANFIEKAAGDTLRLRTYERGVEAETLACGTGACSAAAVAVGRLGLRPPVRVLTRGGDALLIHLEEAEDGSFPRVELEGPAVEVFRGEVEWPRQPR